MYIHIYTYIDVLIWTFHYIDIFVYISIYVHICIMHISHIYFYLYSQSHIANLSPNIYACGVYIHKCLLFHLIPSCPWEIRPWACIGTSTYVYSCTHLLMCMAYHRHVHVHTFIYISCIYISLIKYSHTRNNSYAPSTYHKPRMITIETMILSNSNTNMTKGDSPISRNYDST